MHLRIRRPVACVAACALMVLSRCRHGGSALGIAESTPPPRHGARPAENSGPNAARAARAYEAAVHNGPLALHAFLSQFPKGADLHVHLSGAIYAETFIRDAGEDGLCVDTVALKFAKPPCVEGTIPAARLSGALTPADQDLYDRLVDSFSMRSFVPTPGLSGHDQFFSTFGRFGGLNKEHTGEWVDDAASLAAAQNQQYLELMETPPFDHARAVAHEIGWPANGAELDFARMRQALLDHGIRDEIATDRAHVQEAEATRRKTGALRDCRRRAGLPGGDPLHLPDPARQRAGAGVCAEPAGV